MAEWSEGSQAERKGHLSGDIFMLWGGRPNDKSPIGEPYKSNGERQEQEEKGDGNRGQVVAKLGVYEPVQIRDIEIKKLNASKKEAEDRERCDESLAECVGPITHAEKELRKRPGPNGKESFAIRQVKGKYLSGNDRDENFAG